MLFMGQMVDSNEKWAFYKAYDLEFPSSEELKHMKGIILPGSKHAVYDESHAWVTPLRNFVRSVYDDHPHVKLAGICFGEQLLAAALGGRVERMTNLEHRPLWLLKEEVFLENSFYDLPYVKKVLGNLDDDQMEKIKPLVFHAVHGDHVSKLPDFGVLYGSSERTPVEIWGVENRILAFQCHPEFNSYYIQELVINKMYDQGRLDDS
jgi:GMP synthase-like glutamine amidotransferase